MDWRTVVVEHRTAHAVAAHPSLALLFIAGTRTDDNGENRRGCIWAMNLDVDDNHAGAEPPGGIITVDVSSADTRCSSLMVCDDYLLAAFNTAVYVVDAPSTGPLRNAPQPLDFGATIVPGHPNANEDEEVDELANERRRPFAVHPQLGLILRRTEPIDPEKPHSMTIWRSCRSGGDDEATQRVDAATAASSSSTWSAQPVCVFLPPIYDVDDTIECNEFTFHPTQPWLLQMMGCDDHFVALAVHTGSDGGEGDTSILFSNLDYPFPTDCAGLTSLLECIRTARWHPSAPFIGFKGQSGELSFWSYDLVTASAQPVGMFKVDDGSLHCTGWDANASSSYVVVAESGYATRLSFDAGFGGGGVDARDPSLVVECRRMLPLDEILENEKRWFLSWPLVSPRPSNSAQFIINSSTRCSLVISSWQGAAATPNLSVPRLVTVDVEFARSYDVALMVSIPCTVLASAALLLATFIGGMSVYTGFVVPPILIGIGIAQCVLGGMVRARCCPLDHQARARIAIGLLGSCNAVASLWLVIMPREQRAVAIAAAGVCGSVGALFLRPFMKARRTSAMTLSHGKVLAACIATGILAGVAAWIPVVGWVSLGLSVVCVIAKVRCPPWWWLDWAAFVFLIVTSCTLLTWGTDLVVGYTSIALFFAGMICSVVGFGGVALASVSIGVRAATEDRQAADELLRVYAAWEDRNGYAVASAPTPV